MNDIIIELENVSFEAGDTRILTDASWTVRRDEHWAVLGPNGAGKSTMLKLACGYIWPNAGGEIRRLGKTLSDLRELRKSIGWVSSLLGHQIPGEERVLDTVVSGKFAQTGLKPIGEEHPDKADYDHAMEMLEELHFARLSEKPFGVLSQGEQQIVLIARARMTRPLLVVLDEPCAGLDPASRETLLIALEALARKPGSPSLVMVTHHLEEIMPAFSKMIVIRAGQVWKQGATTELITPEFVSELYGGNPPQLVHRSGRVWPIW